jgi:hypothetical protein
MLFFKGREMATMQGICPSQFEVTRGWMFSFMKRNVAEGTSAKRF